MFHILYCGFYLFTLAAMVAKSKISVFDEKTLWAIFYGLTDRLGACQPCNQLFSKKLATFLKNKNKNLLL
uniref:Uncharacterized protein n=1 Tax=Mus musculus TaxID=10090 RepID=Q3V428_MOUSE|nr:unnamed protein product [Mus musculus]